MTIRIVLVDDQEMYRMGFRMVLEGREDFDVVGEADDGDSALELLGTVEADVVLMDVRMPRMDGVEATRRIRAADGPKVLVLTTFDLDEYAYSAIRAGASGFLLKDTPFAELAAGIEHVHLGDAVVSPSTTRRLFDRFAALPAEPGTARDRGAEVLAALTPREQEVLRLVAQGMPNDGIAAHLFIAEGTVRIHVSRILHKLGLRDRVQAVVLAYETGLVEVGGN